MSELWKLQLKGSKAPAFQKVPPPLSAGLRFPVTPGATSVTSSCLFHSPMLGDSHGAACRPPGHVAPWRYSCLSSALGMLWLHDSFHSSCWHHGGIPVLTLLKTLARQRTAPCLHPVTLSKHLLLFQEVQAPVNSFCHMSLSLWNHSSLSPSLSAQKGSKLITNIRSACPFLILLCLLLLQSEWKT